MNTSVISSKNSITFDMKSSTQPNQKATCLSYIGNRMKFCILAALVLVIFSLSTVRWYTAATLAPVTNTEDAELPSTVPPPKELSSTTLAGRPLPAVAQPNTADSFKNSVKTQPTEPAQHLPHFIVIGVKKSGTRALLNFIKIHPDIETAGMEVHFFDRNESYSKGLDWYRDMMPESEPHQLTGEKSPGYYRTAYVPERIHQMNSSIKLILVVREPIERCMSNYLQHSTKNPSLPSFKTEVLLRNGEVNPQSPHVFNSNYNLFINTWLRWFPLEQLKVVDGNLLITRPYLVMKELQEFLGVRQYIDEKFFHYDEEKGFYCYNNKSTNFKCLGDTKGRKHPEMSPEVKLKLYEYFQPRNELFFKKIGKRFDWHVQLPNGTALPNDNVP